MDRLVAMQVFVAVAQEHGFAAAARRLGLSAPAVTRAVAALEAHLGARLLNRTTRIVRLTDAGARFFADCQRILAEVDEAEASAAGAHAQPQGELVITSPVMFGRLHVAPVVFDFLAAYPRIDVRVLFLDRVVDVMEEGVDVAIRIAHLPDSSLIARRCGAVRRVVCAAPAYLDGHGCPQTPADLERAAVIATASAAPYPDWSFRGTVVKPTPRLTVNSNDVAIAAAVAGHGVVRVLSYQVVDLLRTGALRRVLVDWEPDPVPVHIVHAAGLRAGAKIRAFVDFAAERLRANPVLCGSMPD